MVKGRDLGRLLKLDFSQHSIEAVKKNERLMAKVKMPKDDVDRAYLHYRFIRLNYPTLQWYLTQGYAMLKLLKNPPKYVKRGKSAPTDDGKREGMVMAVDDVGDYSDIIPAELVSEYGEPKGAYSFDNDTGIKQLTKADRKFIAKYRKRHPMSPKFISHVTEGIAVMSGIIDRHHPKVIATFASEDSCRVSALTEYCESRGVKHIDFMHGERFHGYTQAFIRFSEIFVWNQRYREIYEKAHISAEKWVVYVPGKYKPVDRTDEVKNGKVVKCYLCGETRQVATTMRDYLKKLNDKGYRCVIRWHPRFSDVEMTKEIFAGFEFENPREVGMEKSLSEASYAYSTYSTVLLQANYSQIPLIVDDVSDPTLFALLKYIDFWALDAKWAFLSELTER